MQVTPWIALALAVPLAACGGCEDERGGDGKPVIESRLKTQSHAETGLPRGPDRDLKAAAPRLVVHGASRDIVGGIRRVLERDPVAAKANVTVEVATIPTRPPERGQLEVRLLVSAVFAHAPRVTRVDGTMAGTIDYRSASAAQLGGALGDAVADWLAKQRPTGALGTGPAPTGAVAIAVGSPTCSLHEDRTVRCWHRGEEPVPLPALAGTMALDAAANYGACGVRRDGRVYCLDAWSTKVALEARLVCGVAGATSVEVGQGTACALLDTGRVTCWGRRAAWFEPCSGRAAVEVAGIADAVAISVGPFRGCALTRAGAVRCWEHCDARCRSGVVGEIDAAATATVVPGLAKVTAVLAGGRPCAASGRRVTCLEGARREVALPEPVRQLVEGPCAVGESGRVRCWSGTHEPAALPAWRDVRDLDGDPTRLCAVTADGRVGCVDPDEPGAAPVDIVFAY